MRQKYIANHSYYSSFQLPGKDLWDGRLNDKQPKQHTSSSKNETAAQKAGVKARALTACCMWEARCDGRTPGILAHS